MRATGFASVTDFNDESQDQLELRMPKYKRAYEIVSTHLSELANLSEKTRILEVGCAFGFTLEWLHRDFGCAVFGVEPSSEAVKRCRKGGVMVTEATVEEFIRDHQPKTEDEKYDIILIRHCLDCFINPVEILSELKNFLKDDGIFANYSVNVEYYDAMDPYHPFLYSPDSVKRLLAKSGLGVFHQVHAPSPTTHEIAVNVSGSTYEHASFAKKAEPLCLPLPQNLDALEVIKTHKRGAMVQAWSRLSAKDLATRLSKKTVQKSQDSISKIVSFVLPES